MFFLKGCPRCHGDIFVDRDWYGSFLQCVQCGYIKDLEESPTIRVRVLATDTAKKGRETVRQ